MFYEQLKKACKINGTNPSNILKEFNLSTGNTGRWKDGGTPSVEVLLKLADRLKCSTDFLLCLTDIPEPKISLSSEDWNVISAYKKQTPEAQELIKKALGIK